MPQLKSKLTVDQYLAFERAAEQRHNYVDGEVFAVPDGSFRHTVISTNLIMTVGTQLKGTRFHVTYRDLKVRTGIELVSGESTKGMFTYPDILVFCDGVQCHDSHKDIVLNPTAILEILSPDSEGFDRGEKFLRYRLWNSTLCDYVLVSQDKPQVETFTRQPGGAWLMMFYADLEASFTIASIGCTVKLADVYDRVQFVEKPGRTYEE